MHQTWNNASLLRHHLASSGESVNNYKTLETNDVASKPLELSFLHAIVN